MTLESLDTGFCGLAGQNHFSDCPIFSLRLENDAVDSAKDLDICLIEMGKIFLFVFRMLGDLYFTDFLVAFVMVLHLGMHVTALRKIRMRMVVTWRTIALNCVKQFEISPERKIDHELYLWRETTLCSIPCWQSRLTLFVNCKLTFYFAGTIGKKISIRQHLFFNSELFTFESATLRD